MESKIQYTEMNLSEKALSVQGMFDRIAPKYDFLNRLLSMRQDVRWRRALRRDLPRLKAANQSVLDVACGTGDVMCEILALRLDYSQVVGLDLSHQMLEQAGSRKFLKNYLETRNKEPEYSARMTSVQNATARLIHGTATALPFPANHFEAVTISFGLRNVDNREKAITEFERVLKDRGRLFVLEFFPLERSLMGQLFDFYFKKILPFIGGIISDKKAYQYLPESVSSMPCYADFCVMLRKAGFEVVKTQSWLFGGCLLIQAEKK